MAKTILGKIGLIPKGEYDSNISYNRLDFVKYNGSSFVALKDNQGVTPDADDNIWQLLAIKGEKGDKPINGTDYNTETENEEFKNQVVNDSKKDLIEYMTSLKNDLNDYENQKETQLNNYTSDRLNELNSTATSLLKGITDEATSKTELFDSNYNDKVSSFNTNADNKLNTYNDNHKNKVNDYNENADLKVQEYNDNADYLSNLISQIALKNTVIGNPINVEDAMTFPLINGKIKGKTFQIQTNGTNLFDINEQVIRTSLTNLEIDGTTIKAIYDGDTPQINKYGAIKIPDIIVDRILGKKVYVKANVSASTERQGLIRIFDYNNKFALTNNYGSINTSEWTEISLPETLPDGMVGLCLVFYSNASSSSNVSKGDYIEYSNVILSEFPCEYEAYTKGFTSPSINYPQNIEVINELNIKINDETIQIDLKDNFIAENDELHIDLFGNVTLIKHTKKIDNYMDEEITSDYISTTGQLSEGATIYYKLAEPEIANLGKLDKSITLKEGADNLDLISNLNTDMEIMYALDIKKYIDNVLVNKTSEVSE